MSSFIENYNTIAQKISETITDTTDQDMVLRILSELSDKNSYDETLAVLASNPKFEQSCLDNLVQKLLGYSTVPSVVKAMAASEIINILPYNVVIDRMMQAHGRQLTETEWMDLYSELESTSVHPGLLEYIKYQKNVSKPVLAKPAWVSARDGETRQLLDDAYWASKMRSRDVEHLVPNITTQIQKVIDNKDKESEDYCPLPQEIVQDFLSIAKDSEIAALVNDTPLLTFDEETTLDRVYGPINAIINKNCPGSPGEQGPCRMLTCNCREYDSDEDVDDEQDWWEFYEGMCQVCNGKLQDMSHAVRFPVNGGGWCGCYCSFDCMKEEPPRTIYDDDATIMAIMEGTITSTGILDRTLLV